MRRLLKADMSHVFCISVTGMVLGLPISLPRLQTSSFSVLSCRVFGDMLRSSTR